MLDKKRFWSKWSKLTQIDFETSAQKFQLQFKMGKRGHELCPLKSVENYEVEIWFTMQHMDLQ